MAEGGSSDASRESVPGAPLDAMSRAEARRRWTAYRADVWLTLAEARGQGARVAVLRRLRPGSLTFRLVTALAEPAFALRRRWRGPAAPAAAAPSFPFGDEPVATATGVARASEVEVVTVGDGDAASAIRRANGALVGDGWLVVVDESDRLGDGALAQMAALGVASAADLVYADEHARDAAGRLRPVARPARAGWVALLSYDVTGRVVLFSKAALRGIGGFRDAARWSFRHDAVIRLVESGAVAAHLDQTVVETALEDPRRGADLAAVTADALERGGPGGTAEPDAVMPGLVRWRVAAPRAWPTVSVVIPTRDRLDLLRPCLAAIERRTTYPAYEVVIVDNDSVEPATRRFFTETRHRVVAAPGPFNYARVVNRGVAASTGEFVVTLNNDVTITTDDWLEQMVGVASLRDVGIVGVHLRDPAGHAQHEGIAVAPYPQHLRRDRNYVVPDAYLEATREASAVTGACQMISRSLYDELGGLDESLAVVHNDTDLCLRAQCLSRRVVYLATVRLEHAESSSRGALTPVQDIERFIARWDVFGALSDPWFPARWELVGDVIRWRRARPTSRT